MSMSNDMIKEYVKHKLATAVSAGVLKGTTENVAGHSHKFAVMYDENDKMFVGETSFDGRGPHVHYIMAGIRDVVESHLGNPPQPRNEDDIIVDVNEANSPANMRNILDFYNLKEVRLETSEAGRDGHRHGLILRYAGKQIDRMGRKTNAGIQIEQDDEIEKIKASHNKASEELELRLIKSINPISQEKSEATSKEELKKEEKIATDEPKADTRSISDKLIEELRAKSKLTKKKLNTRLKEHGVDEKHLND